VIGDYGRQYLPGTDDLELGFHFARTHWGRGYATEEAAACLEWALTERPRARCRHH
jgi:[ribosomal protein S5]-alanine N-acetyltransferase